MAVANFASLFPVALLDNKQYIITYTNDYRLPKNMDSRRNNIPQGIAYQQVIQYQIALKTSI